MVVLKKDTIPIDPTDVLQGNAMTHPSATLSRKTLLQIGATAFGLIILLMWMEGAFESKADPGLTDAPDAARTSSGQTLQVMPQSTADLIAWPASIAALKSIQIAPKLPGRILEITATAGSTVTRGQLLARIDNTALQAEVGQARSALLAAEASAHRAHADAERLRHLHDREAATRQDLDAAIAADRASAAGVAQAKDAARQAEAMLAETLLRAPYDGVIERRHQEPGDMAQPGGPILTLLQSATLRVEASLPTSCADLLATGDSVSVHSAHPPGDFAAVIDEVQPSSDPQTRTVLVKARLPANTPLNPGNYVWLQHACGQASVLLIPATAVTRIGQLESVRLIVDGHPRLRHVRTGKRYGDAVEILSGLKAGDTLDLSGEPR